MRKVMLVCGLAAAFAAAASPAAYAGQVSGSTTLVGTPTAGQPLTVTVTLKGAYPIVPYEYILENRCWFKGKFNGPVDSTETYPLLGPWFDAGGGAAKSTETVNLNDVPSGAACRTSISHQSAPVKGSTTSYSVS